MAKDGNDTSRKGRHDVPVVPAPQELVSAAGESSKHWFVVGSPPESASQGWKLYISATPSNFCSMLEAICPALVDHGLAFKYVNSIKSLMEINAGIHGFSQIGKCLVVYLHDADLVPALIEALRVILGDLRHEGPVVPRLKRAWGGAAAFYRYGSYRSESICINGESVLDDRSDPSLYEDYVGVDPFYRARLDNHREVNDRSILERFSVTSVICKSGKGGVFNAVDRECEADCGVIVKLGLRHGQELIDGRDGGHFVAHEYSMYELLRENGFGSHLAEVLGFGCEKDATILILEKLDGQDLAVMRRSGGCDSRWIRRAMELINRVHRKGFIFGDAKLANFITCSDSLKMVDLETFQCIDREAYIENPSTFQLTGTGKLTPQEFDIIHFLISAIYLKDDGDKSLRRTRKIDVRLVLESFRPKDDWDIEVLHELSMAVKFSARQASMQGSSS